MAAKKTAGRKPGKHAVSGEGRDGGGRLLPGYTANPNGRPKGIDYRKAVEDYCAKKKVDLAEGIGRVTIALLKQAEEGDVQAAKLLFDRNCGPLKQELDIASRAIVQHLAENTRRDLKGMAERNGSAVLDELEARAEDRET